MKRLLSIDILRGLGILGVIFFHSAVYYFPGIIHIDFNNPPLVVAVIGIMALWGGLFALLSGIVHTYTSIHRKSYNKILFVGVFILLLHFFYSMLLGPTSFDFENGTSKYSLIQASIREGHLALPAFQRFFEGSSLSMIGLNLIFIYAILIVLNKRNNERLKGSMEILLIIIASTVMFTAFLRVILYSQVHELISNVNPFTALILGWLFEKPYPFFPYLSFGLFGSAIGWHLKNSGKYGLKKYMFIGIFWIVVGILVMLLSPTNLVGVDMFWVFKVCLELGLFLIIITGLLSLMDVKKKESGKVANSLLTDFSKYSLSVFLLQTPVSEIISKLMDSLVPGWNSTINNVLLFSLGNIFIWILLMSLWKFVDYKYSFEYFWVKLIKKVGLDTSKPY